MQYILMTHFLCGREIAFSTDKVVRGKYWGKNRKAKKKKERNERERDQPLRGGVGGGRFNSDVVHVHK